MNKLGLTPTPKFGVGLEKADFFMGRRTLDIYN